MPKTITDPDLGLPIAAPQGQRALAGGEEELTPDERLQARFAEIARLSQLLVETEQRLLQQRRNSDGALRGAEQRLLHCQQQLEAAQAELAALHSSSSWRITAPLRFLSRAVRRVARGS